MRSLSIPMILFLLVALLGNPGAKAKEPVVYWESARLAEVKKQVQKPTGPVKKALSKLKKNAEAALRHGPYSVMQKKEVPPSGDKHDYLSYSRYWWPNPDTADGLPYIRHDGKTNVEMRSKGDRDRIGMLYVDVECLALAYYFFEEEEYARHASELIRTWFLNPKTKMNPNLNYGQAVLGRSEGRGVGIIDTRGFIIVLDSVGLLRDSGHFSDTDLQSLKEWFKEYLTWLRTSKLGQKESAARNNHGSWYAAQVARIALFVGSEDIAREIVLAVKAKRIPDQFKSNGEQPYENERTKSLHYCFFNLSALSVVACVGEQLGIDLWEADSETAGSIKMGLHYLLPYLADPDQWPHQQIDKFMLSPRTIQLLRMASVRYQQPGYLTVTEKLPRRHEELDYSVLVSAARKKLIPKVKVLKKKPPETTAYELPDLSRYTSEKIRSSVPKSRDGKVDIVKSADYPLLDEAFRRARGKDLQRRQGTKQTLVIRISDGTVTLGQLAELINDKSIAQQSQTTVTLRLPVLIQPSGNLIIDGAETAKLRLSTDRGAFVANAGSLFVVDARVTSWDEATDKPSFFSDEAEFRPFISSYIRSETMLANSTFEHLGYLAPTAYGLSLSSHPERNRGMPSNDWPTGQIIDCVFIGMYYGFYSYEARKVAIVGNTYDGSIRYGIDPHDRSTGLIIAENTAKSTQERHGIIGSREVTNSYIFRNTSYDNTGSGIMLDRHCSKNTVVENRVFRNGQGIAIYESSDNLVARNFVVENEKSGIRIRNSTGAVVENNTIVGNGDYAFEVYSKRLDDHTKRVLRGDHYEERVEASIRRNTTSGNKGCLKGSHVHSLTLSEMRAKPDLEKLKLLIPAFDTSIEGSRDQEFGSQLKPFRYELRQAFESPDRVVEIRSY